MKNTAQSWLPLMASLSLSLAASGAIAKVGETEAAKLGKELTCVGAEAGPNADGSISAFSGKWLGKPPNVEYTLHAGQHPVDVYPDDKALFEITAANMEQYAEKLSDGQKAMFKKHPDTFRIPVYQTRRDFRYPDTVCEISKKNALSAELIDDGLGFNALKGGRLFPFQVKPWKYWRMLTFLIGHGAKRWFATLPTSLLMAASSGVVRKTII